MPNEVIRVVRGNKSQTKQAFFNEVAAALQFPYYFGENWDAFNECMNDLRDWLPASSYLLIVSNADQLLSHETMGQVETLVKVLERSAHRWESGLNYERYRQSSLQELNAQETTGFKVAFQYNPETALEENFQKWFKAAKIPIYNLE